MHRLMSLVDFPPSPYAYTGLGLCCPHAAYCCLRVLMWWGNIGGGVGGSREGRVGGL